MGSFYMESTQINYRRDETVKTVDQKLQELSETSAIDTDIAPVFKSTNTYAPGDMVYYRNKLYVFNVEHTGAWAAADVTATDVTTELSSLKSGLANYQTQNDLNLEVPNRKNLCDNSKNGAGYYGETGAYQDNVHYATSDLIPVEQGKTYVASIFNKTTSERIGALVYTTWDASKNFIAQSTSVTITIGSGVSYVRIRNFQDQTTYIDGDNYVYQLEQGSTATSYTPYIPSVESRIEAVESGLNDKANIINTVSIYFGVSQDGQHYVFDMSLFSYPSNRYACLLVTSTQNENLDGHVISGYVASTGFFFNAENVAWDSVNKTITVDIGVSGWCMPLLLLPNGLV